MCGEGVVVVAGMGDAAAAEGVGDNKGDEGVVVGVGVGESVGESGSGEGEGVGGLYSSSGYLSLQAFKPPSRL